MPGPIRRSCVRPYSALWYPQWTYHLPCPFRGLYPPDGVSCGAAAKLGVGGRGEQKQAQQQREWGMPDHGGQTAGTKEKRATVHLGAKVGWARGHSMDFGLTWNHTHKPWVRWGEEVALEARHEFGVGGVGPQLACGTAGGGLGGSRWPMAGVGRGEDANRAGSSQLASNGVCCPTAKVDSRSAGLSYKASRQAPRGSF